jgi:peroxiredoxin
MRFPRLSANAWVCLIVFLALVATTTEQLLRPRPPVEKVEAARSSQPDFKFAGPFKIDAPAPDFTLKDAKGRAVSLHQFRGKRVLLNFFCGCSYCRGVAMAWSGLLKEPKIRPTVTVAVASFKEDYDQQFRKETGWKGPILYDTPQRDIATKYDSRICPRVWVLDEQGRILYTNHSPAEEPPGPQIEMAVRPFVSLAPQPPGGIHAGAPHSGPPGPG